MQRKLAREKTERFSPTRLDDRAQHLRDRCYLWALTHAQDLHEVYEAADTTFSDLDFLDDRARDLWEPLVSIAAIADVTRGDETHTFTTDLTALARDLGQVREGTLENSTMAQILQALCRIAEHESIPNQTAVALAPKVLADRLLRELEWSSLSARYLATILAPLGLHAQKTRQGTKVIRAYHMKPNELAELCERYGSVDENGNEKNV